MQVTDCKMCGERVQYFRCVISLDVSMSVVRSRGSWTTRKPTIGSKDVNTDPNKLVATCPHCGHKDTLEELAVLQTACDECGKAIDEDFPAHCTYSNIDVCKDHYRRYISRNCKVCPETDVCAMYQHWNTDKKATKHKPPERVRVDNFPF
jgi:hypothetical protein